MTDRLEVVRVRTKQTLAKPEIAQLIMRGAAKIGFPVPAAVLADLCLNPGDNRLGTFIGSLNHIPCAVVITQQPLSAFMLHPMVVLAYAERAPAELVRLLGARTREWLRAAGFTRAMALNIRHSDRAFCRGLAHFGVPARIGGVITFRLTPESSEEQRD